MQHTEYWYTIEFESLKRYTNYAPNQKSAFCQNPQENIDY